MKFVCDNCKAKYQIGDDKVAGKTLRMKCRRCGHMIQVAATVTETSVSEGLPGEAVTGSAAAPFGAATPPAGSGLGAPPGVGAASGLGAPPGTSAAPRPPRPPQAAPPPPAKLPDFEAPDTVGEDNEGATVIRQSPFLVAEMARAVKDRGAVAPPAPRPSIPRIVPPARASIRSAPPPAGPAGLEVASAPMHSVSSPGLYSGFQNAVAAPTSPPASSHQLPTEDWYVGVGGVPLGPVRLSVIRDKATAGQVDRDSLVWREGFDEWQAVRAFPELLALVEEAKASRLSRTGLPAVSGPSGGHTPVPLGMTPAPRPSITSAAPLAPIPDAAPSLPFDLVRGSTPMPPGAAPSGAPGNGSAIAGGPLVVKDPFAAPSAAPIGVASAAAGYGLTTTQGTALAGPPAGADVASRPAPLSVPPPSVQKKRGVHPMAWAMIAMAAAFGGVAAWALLFRDAKTEIRYVDKTASAADPGLGAAPPAPPTGAATSADSAAPAASVSGNPVAGGPIAKNGGPSTTATAKPGETAPPLDTSGFGSGVGGPSATGTSDSGKSGGELTEGEINGVVSRGKPGITRRCWTPAYDARPSDAPKSAKVNASVKIGPSGSVQSVSASGGGNAYPSLAGCVSGAIKSWQFPPSDGGATVNIPFVFSGQ